MIKETLSFMRVWTAYSIRADPIPLFQASGVTAIHRISETMLFLDRRVMKPTTPSRTSAIYV